MNKSSWEVVDETLPKRPATAQHLLPSFLGDWWKWKAALLIVLATVMLIVFVTFAGVLVLLASVVVLLALLLKKLMRWLRGTQSVH